MDIDIIPASITESVDIVEPFSSTSKYYEVMEQGPDSNPQKLYARQVQPEDASDAFDKGVVFEVNGSNVLVPQNLMDRFTGSTSMHLQDLNGVEEAHETTNFEIREFTKTEMTALSSFFLASFAAAEARKRIEAQKKEEEEKKKQELDKLEKALRDHHHPISSSSDKQMAKPVKESITPDTVSSKNKKQRSSSNEFSDQLNGELKSHKEKEERAKIDKYHEKMIQNVQSDRAKKELEKNAINDDNLKKQI